MPVIAEFCAVSPQTVNQWRPGQQRAPLGRVVFLTLLLSHMVDELVRTYDRWGPAPKTWHLHMKSCLEGARQALIEQHSQNEGAPAGAFRQGERFFDQWKQGDAARNWSAEAAQRVALGTGHHRVGVVRMKNITTETTEITEKKILCDLCDLCVLCGEKSAGA